MAKSRPMANTRPQTGVGGIVFAWTNNGENVLENGTKQRHRARYCSLGTCKAIPSVLSLPLLYGLKILHTHLSRFP